MLVQLMTANKNMVNQVVSNNYPGKKKPSYIKSNFFLQLQEKNAGSQAVPFYEKKRKYM